MKDLWQLLLRMEITAKLSHLTSASVRAKEALRLRRKQFFTSQHVRIFAKYYACHSILTSVLDPLVPQRLYKYAFRMPPVVGAYEYAGGGLQSCAEQFVRPKVLHQRCIVNSPPYSTFLRGRTWAQINQQLVPRENKTRSCKKIQELYYSLRRSRPST